MEGEALIGSLCGRGVYAFTCIICGQPGIGKVPLTNTHAECRAEARKRMDVKTRAKKKRKSK